MSNVTVRKTRKLSAAGRNILIGMAVLVVASVYVLIRY